MKNLNLVLIIGSCLVLTCGAQAKSTKIGRDVAQFSGYTQEQALSYVLQSQKLADAKAGELGSRVLTEITVERKDGSTQFKLAYKYESGGAPCYVVAVVTAVKNGPLGAQGSGVKPSLESFKAICAQ